MRITPTIAAIAVIATMASAAIEAQTGQSPAAQIAALHGAMPPSFDIYPNDACAGSWAVPSGDRNISVSVIRYRRLPLVHIVLPDGGEQNRVPQRLGPHTISFKINDATLTMQCLGQGTAMVDVMTDGGDHPNHQRITAQEAAPPPPSSRTSIAPIARPAAPVRRSSDDEGGYECRGEPPRKTTPSLDGGFVYQQVCRAVTSDMIVQIRKSDGQRRDVTSGNSLAVLRNGPWRGMLLVSKHKYKAEGGSYDATWVVRPDGKEMLQVPGTEDGDDRQLAAWLASKGWVAN